MILYASTQFSSNEGAPTLLAGSAITGQDGYAASCQVDETGVYTESGGLNITTTGTRVGSTIQDQNASDTVGPYHQVTSVMGNFTGEESKFLLAFCNTADIDVPTWVATTGLLDGEEKDWGLNPPPSPSVGLHTPNLTDDVYTLIVPTTSTIRQATNTRNGNSIVFHIPQNSLAVYAINANLNTSNSITISMTDTQASERILGYGYGLILRTAGSTILFNQS